MAGRALIRGSASALPLASESVQTCVTSPPYWGLRQYAGEQREVWGGDVGHAHEWSLRNEYHNHGDSSAGAKQRTNHGAVTARGVIADGSCACGAWYGALGLEPTPELYVEHMVAIFREVKRVLRRDGTLWINLGSSMSTGAMSRDRGRPAVYGTADIVRSGYRDGGSSSSDLCDGCRAALLHRTSRNDSLHAPESSADVVGPSRGHTQSSGSYSGSSDSEHQPRNEQSHRAKRGRQLAQDHADAQLLDAPMSTIPESSQPPRDACSHCSNCGACLDVLASASRDSQACARTAAYMSDNAPLVSASHNSDTDASGMAWLNYTRSLGPKQLVPIPWMVAMALQQDGWILRCDIIWDKKNPMPESVSDRPTKSHEYLFLLSKAQTYYFDNEAIREAATGHDPGSLGVHAANKFDRSAGNRDGLGASTLHTLAAARNRRSVWTIATQPWSGAHFATFPEALVEPCILAGSRPGDLVMDSFNGSGTTGRVAVRHGRNYVGIDISDEYLRVQSRKRIDNIQHVMGGL